MQNTHEAAVVILFYNLHAQIAVQHLAQRMHCVFAARLRALRRINAPEPQLNDLTVRSRKRFIGDFDVGRVAVDDGPRTTEVGNSPLVRKVGEAR